MKARDAELVAVAIVGKPGEFDATARPPEFHYRTVEYRLGVRYEYAHITEYADWSAEDSRKLLALDIPAAPVASLEADKP